MTDIEKQIEFLCSNREEFNKFVYTSIDEAISEYTKRQDDNVLTKKIEEFLGKNIPEPLLSEPRFTLARHLVTPNYEISRFLVISDTLGYKPLFLEYHDDKLIYKNSWKYSLGKIPFHSGNGKKGGLKIETTSIIDFNESHGRKISDVKTVWGESLIKLHHDFFIERFPNFKDSMYDASDWYASNGSGPEEYYVKFLSLFVRNGILFENFLLDETEIEFTKKIILPAIIKIKEMFGYKPVIVSLMPTDIEGDGFWLCHPACTSDYVKSKLLK